MESISTLRGMIASSLIVMFVIAPLNIIFAEENEATVVSSTDETTVDTNEEAIEPVENEADTTEPAELTGTDETSATEESSPSYDEVTSQTLSNEETIDSIAASEGVHTESGEGEELAETSSSTVQAAPLETLESTTTSNDATTTVLNEEAGMTPNLDTSDDVVEVVTGDAIALANIFNLVNTNFINSDGVVVFDNFFEALFGDIDLRSIYNSLTQFGCSLISCSQDNVTANISNEAAIQNALLIQALTGRNAIESEGDASISTGNAYAGLNLINIANTNVIDSNYLLVTMNAFQDVNGDIVFPSLDSFFNTLSGGVSPAALDITNTAQVANNVDITAQTGNNTIEGSGQSEISTGASGATTNVFNQLNTTLAGGQSISILFRVHGNWAGEIFGAPPNLGWMEDGQGGIYLFDTATGGASQADNLTLSATNNAAIQNDVQVVALTGENAITGADTALISTGNAFAGVNIVNVANATVVGRNWILAIINILGDFNGNISFGRPDLWVGSQVHVPDEITNDSELTYTMTVINNGDAPASQVFLTDDYDERYLRITDSSVPYETQNGKNVWSIGTLPPGMATEITYTAQVQNTTHGTDISNHIAVTERETDNNRTDNSDTIVVTTSRPERNGTNARISLSRSSSESEENVATVQSTDVDVVRVTESTILSEEAGEATQKLIVSNTTGNRITAVVLHDILSSPTGELIKDEVWDLGDILPHEEITIEYTITFAKDAARGRYQLSTSIEGENLPSRFLSENGEIRLENLLRESLVLFESTQTPSSAGAVPEVLGATHTEEYSDDGGMVSILPFVIPTAYAAARTDHGLPMTHVPYRYSAYLFLLAIALSNLYYMAQRSKDPNEREM